MLTRQLSESCVYDILILATGYERKTHVKLLESKSIAEAFGLESGVSLQNDALSSRATPGVLRELLLGQEVSALQDTDALDSSSTPSVTSSGTSLGTSLGTSSATSSDGTQKSLISRLNITRNYRLISKAAASSPRIYLQGCSEATHGISETLLSVVSVRAGEILADILEGYRE
jgi:L-ornithine N5-oxygenase